MCFVILRINNVFAQSLIICFQYNKFNSNDYSVTVTEFTSDKLCYCHGNFPLIPYNFTIAIMTNQVIKNVTCVKLCDIIVLLVVHINHLASTFLKSKMYADKERYIYMMDLCQAGTGLFKYVEIFFSECILFCWFLSVRVWMINFEQEIMFVDFDLELPSYNMST